METNAEVRPLKYLYVDCAPVKGPYTEFIRLEEEIASRAAEIVTEYNTLKALPEGRRLVDVREIPFGEGTAALVASFKRRPLTGLVLASSGGLSTQVIEVLAPQADTVVRGNR